MATTALINRTDYGYRRLDFGTDVETGPDVMIFDSVIRESHKFEIAITENPVETGVSMADHAYAKPDILTMEVRVSDTPMLRDDQGTPSEKLAYTQGWKFSGHGWRSVYAWQEILRKAKSFAVFDVQTGLRLYTNMMFESGSAEQTKDTAGVLKATIQLHQVTFATTATVVYPPRAPGKPARKAAPVANGGKKEAEEAKPAEVKPISLAAQGLGWVVDLPIAGAP